ncbi:MAG: LuxR C-terminal-related transcriptional regulator [Acidimicrobiia bacterium]|nr:LuxR C-terminal-related transcriptional regulator [Acidimicrobiia bacterium]
MGGHLVGRARPLERALDACQPDRGGALLAGPPGVGKTRILEEVADTLQRAGMSVERFAATDALQPLTFGPFLGLLGGRLETDPAQLLVRVRETLVGRAGGRQLCVAVDDVHLLDDMSIACLTDLARRSGVFVCLTLRTTLDSPDSLMGLWTGGLLERIDIGPLDDAETAELAGDLLGGPLDVDLRDALTAAVDGNPLLLRELLLDATASGAIRRHGDVWHLAGTLRSGPRIGDLVTARTRTLDDLERLILELVAVDEPLPVAALDDREAEVLDRLESQRLVRVERSGAGLAAHPDHPLVGEAVRAALPTRRHVEVLRGLVRRMMAAGGPAPGDALRTARWSLAAGDTPPPEVALAGAREALAFDVEQAATLAGASLSGCETAAALLVLGEALRLGGDIDGAAAALERAAVLAEDDDDVVRIAMLRSNLLALQGGRPAQALELLDEAAAAVQDPVRALELTSEASYLAGLLGRFEDVLRTSRVILERGDLHPDAAWTTNVNLLYAQTMLGRLEGAEATFEHTRTLADGVQHERPEGVDLLWALRTGMFIQLGELVCGERVIAAHLDRCRAAGVVHGLTAAIFVELLTLRGTPALFPLIERTFEELERSDPYVVFPIAAGSAAVAHVLAGRPDDAATALARVPEVLDDVRARPFVARGRAALLAHSGQPDEAAALVADAGREAVAASHVSFGVLALHDATRFGRPDLVADDLEAATRSCAAPLLLAMAGHVRALVDGDGPALDDLARTIAGWGAPHLAAEIAADAARIHPEGSAAALRAAARSAWWARFAPILVAPEVEVSGALSARELDVVALAVAGATNRELAEQLYLSVRTVENHLQRAYAKLEVPGRSGIADIFDPQPGDASGHGHEGEHQPAVGV